jgi:hypothetical protein
VAKHQKPKDTGSKGKDRDFGERAAKFKIPAKPPSEKPEQQQQSGGSDGGNAAEDS